MIAIPSILTINDFLKYLSTYKDNIEKIRLVKNKLPNNYMGILKFKDEKIAKEFYLEYNLKKYNSFDPQKCILLFISEIEIFLKNKNENNYFIISPINKKNNFNNIENFKEENIIKDLEEKNIIEKKNIENFKEENIKDLEKNIIEKKNIEKKIEIPTCSGKKKIFKIKYV
jgi:hypothetical protein